MTGGFMMMMDFSDLFVSLSLCLSLCLSLSLSLYLSLCLSLPDLSVALCLVRCTPRVGVHVHRREDGGIGQETNDRQPVSRRYPGGIQARLVVVVVVVVGVPSGHQRVVSLPPVHVRTDTQTERKDSPRRPVIGAYQRVLALQVRAKYGERVLVGVADRESSVSSVST